MSATSSASRSARSFPSKAAAWSRERAAGLLLAAIVLGAFLLTARYSARITEWLVMTDEMQYVKLSLGIAGGDPVPRLHGTYYASLNQLYPLLLAPVTGLLSAPDAFRAAHVLNAAIMASAAVPAYLLTRHLVRSRAAALFAAALAVTVPWMAMSAILMTEVAGYPAFLWGVLGMQRALAEPSVKHDLWAIAAIALAVLARTQYVLLAVLFPVLVVLHEGGYALLALRGRERAESLKRAMRGHVVFGVVALLAVIVLVPVAIAGKLPSLLGQYAATASGDLTPDGLGRLAVHHVDLIVVGLGVVPGILGIGWAASSSLWPSEKRLHAFALVTLVTGVALAAQVASFNLRFGGGVVQTRYIFPLAGLLIVAAIACILDRRRHVIGVVGASVALAIALPRYGYVPSPGPYFSSPDTAFHQVLWGKARALGDLFGRLELAFGELLKVAVPLAGVALAAALWFAPRRIVLYAVAGALLLFSVLETRYVLAAVTSRPNGPRPVRGGSLDGRDWIDRAAPEGGVAMLPTPLGTTPVAPGDAAYFSQVLWWDTEFWNKGVDQVYALPGVESYSAWPKPLLRVDEATGRLEVADQRRYVVQAPSDVRFRLHRSRVVARTPELELLDAPRPYRVEWSTSGLGVDGTPLPGGVVRVRVYGAPDIGERRRVTLALTAAGAPDSRQRFRLTGGDARAGGTLAAGATGEPAVDVCAPANGHVDVELRLPAPPEGTPPAAVHVGQVTARPVSGVCP